MSGAKPMSAAEVNEYVGRRIRGCRKALGMTQGTLAARVGLSKPWVTLAEGGQRNLSVANLMAVAAVLGVNAADLLPPVVTGD